MRFPKDTHDRSVYVAELERAQTALENTNVHRNLGHLHTTPDPDALLIFESFLPHNPNNLGNWSTAERELTGTQKLERDVIEMMVDLYSGEPSVYGGYITSGGSEGNIYMLWLGRMELEHLIDPQKICLLQTPLTHYSISKAACMMRVMTHTIPLDPKKWNLGISGLHKNISYLYKKGYRGFILPLTVGYTLTGTSDDVDEISRLISSLKLKFSNAEFFVWVDAALGGLVVPFCDESFAPLKAKHIQGIIADFHKFGSIPYGAGVVLCRKELMRHVSDDIPYLLQTDSTLLGSRQGAFAASIWASIHFMSRTGFRKLVTQQIKNKERFIGTIKRYGDVVNVITEKNSVTCAVEFPRLDGKRLPRWFEKKYWLFAKEQTYDFDNDESVQATLYKFHFLPHVTEALLGEFEGDLCSLAEVS